MHTGHCHKLRVATPNCKPFRRLQGRTMKAMQAVRTPEPLPTSSTLHTYVDQTNSQWYSCSSKRHRLTKERDTLHVSTQVMCMTATRQQHLSKGNRPRAVHGLIAEAGAGAPVARLQLQGLQAGGMHVWCRHVESQPCQGQRRVQECICISLLLWHKGVPGAGLHSCYYAGPACRSNICGSSQHSALAAA